MAACCMFAGSLNEWFSLPFTEQVVPATVMSPMSNLFKPVTFLTTQSAGRINVLMQPQ